jgi:hypothetical protein
MPSSAEEEHLVLWGQVEHGHKKAGHLGPAQCIY